MKRALHLLDTLQFGGGENVALQYARLLAEREVESTLVGRPVSPAFIEQASRWCSTAPRPTPRLLRRADILFVHTNRQLLRLFLLRAGCRFRRKEVIYIQHLPCGERKFRLLSRIVNRICTGFVRITPITEALVGQYIKIPVCYLPNFYRPQYERADHPRIRREVRRQYGIPEDRTIVLFSGILRPGKGLAEFLALAERAAGDPHRLFVVAGDGEQAPLIREHGGKNLLWTGMAGDMERLLIASDVYCFLSRREMMPMALVEALAVGIPVAALASPVNDALLGGQTFGTLDVLQQAIGEGRVPVDFASRPDPLPELERLLRIGERKKILHIQVLPKLTGVQRISLAIFRSLPDELYDKTILFGPAEAGGDARECFDSFREAGARVLTMPNLRRELSLRDVRAFVELWRLCRRERFDIVHTHSTKPGIVGRIAARLTGVPLVIHTVHGVAFHHYQRPVRRAAYYLAEAAASFFSHRTTLVTPCYQPFYRHVRRRISVIPNGMDFGAWDEQAKRCVGERDDPDTIRFLFAGRLEVQKDPLTLLRAFERIVRSGLDNVRLTLVGDGELTGPCRRFVDEHGLGDRVELAGWQSNVVPYYRNHDIFCLPSIFESFGLCLLEAGFSGLPTVATCVEGIPEVVADGETGFLVAPRDPDALAARMVALADDPALRRRMGEAARRRVTTLFPLERMTGSYRRIYEKGNV
jgi:glycosyltransferase involved in cell wall biosynthesis